MLILNNHSIYGDVSETKCKSSCIELTSTDASEKYLTNRFDVDTI